ncbi:MAG: MlaE family ABC transporter permease [Candidatus Kapaibacteriota bacterium]
MQKQNVQNKTEAYKIEYKNDLAVVYFYGEFLLTEADKYNGLFNSNYFKNIQTIILDFKNVDKYDSFIVTYIEIIKQEAKSRNITLDIREMSPGMLKLYQYLSHFKEIQIKREAQKVNNVVLFFEKIGDISKSIVTDGVNFITFIGDVIRGIFKMFFLPKDIRWQDFPYHIFQIGVNALPIALLIVFLIGLITGYQGALQLKTFGADLYIADLISISITRELGPLMVAIIVAGRSGSAFTAEIGTMKVSEEVDALHVMGFNIIDFLVMPRLMAILIAMPILVIMADLLGVFGGLLAALSSLDITAIGYFNRMQVVLGINDIASGIIKSLIFGFFITIIGCFRGLQVKGGAESVGRYTTSSVVTSIFHIILIDAIFTIIFPIIGL